MNDSTFYVLFAHVTKKNVTINYKNAELNIDVNNLKFSLNGSSFEKLSLSISQFKNRKCKGGGKYVSLQGETGEISSLKLEFRDNDPNQMHVTECFNIMFDKYKSISVAGSKPQKRIVEHETRKPTVPCNLIRKSTWSQCSSENNNSQPSDYINSPACKDLFPMNSMNKQTAPLLKSPLKSKNETVSKLNQSGKFSERRSNATPSYSAPNVSTNTPKSTAPMLPKTSTSKTPSSIESPKSRPSKTTQKRSLYVDPDVDDDVHITTPTRHQNSIKVKAAPLPLAAKLRSAESSSVDKFENRKLVNIGNSCYMNSTFQALSALDHFTFRMRQVHIYLTSHRYAEIRKMPPDGQKKLDLIKLTCDIVDNLHAKCKPQEPIRAVEEKVLLGVREAVGSVNQRFDNSLQQDAHEFMLEYLAQIETMIKRLSRKFFRNDYGELPTDNVDQYLLNHYDFRKICPSDTFVIKTELRIICSNCEHSRTQGQGYQLDVNVTLRANKNLQELVNETFPCIYNPDVNCEECDLKGAKMSTRIGTFPESFIISLKRYVVSHNSSPKKIDMIVPVSKFLYTNQISEFQDEIMEFTDDEIEVEEALETATSFSPTTISMDETQQKSVEITPPPTTPEVVKRRSSGHVNLFGSAEKTELYFDCETNFNSKYDEKEEPVLAKLDKTQFGDDQDMEIDDDQDLGTDDVRMLGGADEKPAQVERKDSDDCEIVDEKVCVTVSFAPLNDYNEICEILDEININIEEDTLRRHLERFPKEMREIPISTAPRLVHPVDADGNCFYRCISWLLTADQEFHKELRKTNVDFIDRYKEVFSTITHEPIENIIATARKDNEWSSEIEIIAMCTFLKCDIHTYFCKKWVRYQPRWVNGEKRARSLYLINKEQVHFEPVINIATAVKPRGVKRTSSRLSDDDCNIDRSDDEMPTSRQSLSRSCKIGKTYVEGGSTSGKKNENNRKKGRVQDEIDWEAADGSPVYVLSSVVCHQGLSVNSGHYIAYTRNASTDEWLYCSDEVVHTVSETKALTDCAKKGYVFFYSKVCP